jgi:hypothetical protein
MLSTLEKISNCLYVAAVSSWDISAKTDDPRGKRRKSRT